MKQGVRSAILDAAEQVMTAQGLRAARMEDIAARVGVSVGTLYNYFKDRQRLLDALLDLRGQELLAGLDGALERSEGLPYRARLQGFLQCLLEHAWTHLRLFGLLLEDAMVHGVPGDKSLERHQGMSREVARRLEELNRDGVRQGLLRPEDGAHYPTLLMGMVQAVVFEQLLSSQSASVEGTVEVLLRCFLDGAQPRVKRASRSARRR
ncbi:MAG TPA: TetR/AcrR family transcriptional regulator [Myxococcaceae bacterium]